MTTNPRRVLCRFLVVLAVALAVPACEGPAVPAPPPITAATPIPVASAAPRGDRVLSMDVVEAADGDFEAALSAAQASKSSCVSTMTRIPISACAVPQNSAHCPQNTPTESAANHS